MRIKENSLAGGKKNDKGTKKKGIKGKYTRYGFGTDVYLDGNRNIFETFIIIGVN